MNEDKPPNARRVRAAQTAEELKAAARAVFARQGYLNTKIVDITSEAGRAAGSFYNHFATKEEVLAALADDIGRAADELVEARTALTAREHIAVFWRTYAAHRDVFEALDQASLVNDTFAHQMREFRAVQLQPWVVWLTTIADEGGRLPASAAVTADIIVAAAEIMIRNWSGDVDDGIDRLVDFVESGIVRS